MDPMLVWGLVLMGSAVLLLVVELFVPSGGIISITSAVLAIAGVVCLWRYDTMAGLGGALSVMVLGPAAIAFMVKVWPNTPMGRRLINAPSEEEVFAQRQQEEQQRNQRLALIGKEGKVVTDLRPIGLVEIEGQRYEVLSETHFVPAGSRVKVTQADMSQLKVRQE
jgi:membrane-bound ClpP family serine protease